MRVRQVLGSGVRRETCTVVDDDGRVVELVDDYLALCTDREHSPNTLRARAYDLKEWLTFLRLLDIKDSWPAVRSWAQPISSAVGVKNVQHSCRGQPPELRIGRALDRRHPRALSGRPGPRTRTP